MKGLSLTSFPPPLPHMMCSKLEKKKQILTKPEGKQPQPSRLLWARKIILYQIHRQAFLRRHPALKKRPQVKPFLKELIKQLSVYQLAYHPGRQTGEVRKKINYSWIIIAL